MLLLFLLQMMVMMMIPRQGETSHCTSMIVTELQRTISKIVPCEEKVKKKTLMMISIPSAVVVVVVVVQVVDFHVVAP